MSATAVFDALSQHLPQDAYTRLCGATGIKAECRDQLDQAMTQLSAAEDPAMLHVSQDPEVL